MPRFAKQRFIQFPPAVVLFKPQGVPMRTLERVVIGLDEYEMLRLVDYEGRDIEAAAESLRVSRATAGRILESARRKSAEALCGGKAILIEGGTVVVGGRRFRCGSCGVLWDVPGAAGTEEPAGTERPAGTDLREKGSSACPSCEGENIIDLGGGRGQGGRRGGPGGGNGPRSGR